MYEFTEDCMIHIDSIDNEHKRLFNIINEAISTIAVSDDVTVLANEILKNLKFYAATHFAHEEEYMKSINDPELPLQQKQHAAFTEKINSFSVEGMSADEAKNALNDLLTYLVRWLYGHILSSDIMIGKMRTYYSTTNGDGSASVESANSDSESDDPFAFTDKYKTGVDMIDDEHRRLFEIIKDTNYVIHTEFVHDKYDEIMRLLGELKDYTEFHFHDEEEYMKSINYPELEAQKRAHSAFVERLVEIDLEELDEIDDNQQEYLINLIDFLLGWLSNHILGADKKIGEYAKSITSN